MIMRINPPNKTSLAKKEDAERVKEITRKVAIGLAIVGVYIFFFKLLFF